ncbi:MAG: purine-binding chemotaxis protein CheW [Nitrospirae bacterium]|nr:purine-binding chemotaxis protein CheW [Nitrospirota bacterium]
MDIAKIRKKIKQSETDNQQSRINSRAKEEKQTYVTAADKKPSEPEPSALTEQSPPPEIEAKQEQESEHEEETTGKPGYTETLRTEEKIGNYKTDELIEILSFNLLKEEFAIRISELEEILKPQRITKVPKIPDYVIGITSLRGKVIPVIDLKLKLSLTDKPSQLDHKGKILILKGPEGQIGATVDRVIGVIRVEKSEILPPPSHLTEVELEFIEGVTVRDKRFISIIKMEEAICINLK